MFFSSAHPVVDVYPEAVSRNWRYISSFASNPPASNSPGNPTGMSGGIAWPGTMAVVKADAYGHGLLPVSRALLAAGARAFAVGDIREGVALAQGLSRTPQCPETIVLPLLGPETTREADRCLAYGLVPILHRPGQAAMLSARVRASGRLSGRADRSIRAGREDQECRVPVAIKVDTGLSRLGFREEGLAALFEELAAADNLVPSLLVSHYAKADDPADRDTTEDQARLFLRFLAAFRSRWPDMAASIANSAALLNSPPSLFRELGANVLRPGISLYGPNPFVGTVLEKKGAGFAPAMEVRCPVLEIKTIPAGAKVSYGHTFVATHTMRLAVLAAGYADGLSRRLSGIGAVCIHGRRAPRLGRVCMQMHMVDVTHIPQCRVGDAAYILGGPGEGVSADELAAWCGTLPHELFCVFGGKNPRKFCKGLPGKSA